MTRLPRRLAKSLLARRGVTVSAVDDRAWLVRRDDRKMVIDELGAGGLLMQPRPRKLVAQRIGGPKLNTHVVTEQRILRSGMHRYQLRMADHLSTHHLSWLLRELQITCILDVGANQGQFATRMRESGFTGRIVSFEPVAHLLEKVRAKAESDPAWRVMPYALGEEEGEAEIHVASGPGTTSSLLDASEFGRDNFRGLRQESHTETIQVRRLDSLFDEAVEGLDDPRVFLKMDTQGFDLPALRGAGDRIKQISGLQSEVACVPLYDGMPRLPEQLTEYEAAGFELSAMFPVSFHKETLRAIELDLLMVRPEKVRPRA